MLPHGLDNSRSGATATSEDRGAPLVGLMFSCFEIRGIFFSSSQDESHSFTHSSILGSYKMCSITDFTFSPRGLSVGLYRGQGNQALARKSRTLMSFV